jgi:hypothetical protein
LGGDKWNTIAYIHNVRFIIPGENSTSALWERRCRSLLCCVKGANTSFEELGAHPPFSQFFHGIDFLPSDIVAGLSLLRAQDRAINLLKGHDEIDEVDAKELERAN